MNPTAPEQPSPTTTMPETISLHCPHCGSSGSLVLDTLTNFTQEYLDVDLVCLECKERTTLLIDTSSPGTATLGPIGLLPPAPEPPTAQQLLVQAMALLEQQALPALPPAEAMPVVLTDDEPAPSPAPWPQGPDTWQQQWGEPLRWWKYTSGFNVPCEVCGGPCTKGEQVRYLPADRSPSHIGQTMHRECWARVSGLDVDR